MKRKGNEGPLTTAALHILLALSEVQLHGYGIMQAVKRLSDNNYKLGPGTLYANLAILLEKGWVGDTQRKMQDGSLRREYFLTANGQEVLRAEVERLHHLVAPARRRLARFNERDA